MNTNTHKGLYKPTNPKKYVGNVKQIVYRSWWEFCYFKRLDEDPKIAKWSSEEFFIRYLSPKDNRPHRYFPDVFYETVTGKKFLIEIKPLAQSIPPKTSGKKSKKKMLMEVMTYEVNQAKWKAAQEWCLKRNVTFKVLTEKELFPSGKMPVKPPQRKKRVTLNNSFIRKRKRK